MYSSALLDRQNRRRATQAPTLAFSESIADSDNPDCESNGESDGDDEGMALNLQPSPSGTSPSDTPESQIQPMSQPLSVLQTMDVDQSFVPDWDVLLDLDGSHWSPAVVDGFDFARNDADFSFAETMNDSYPNFDFMDPSLINQDQVNLIPYKGMPEEKEREIETRSDDNTDKKGDVTIILKQSNSDLLQKVVGSLKEANADITIHLLKD